MGEKFEDNTGAETVRRRADRARCDTGLREGQGQMMMFARGEGPVIAREAVAWRRHGQGL